MFLVCTCTVTGFLCEDQCETIPASTSIGKGIARSRCIAHFLSVSESSTTSSSSSSSPSADQLILSSPFPPSPVFNLNTNVPPPLTSGPSTQISSIPEDESSNAVPSGSCSRAVANGGLSGAREYAFADCSEVYLAGKRTSGIYEIW